MISEHLNENNLHHAYLIEGAREEIVPEIFIFIESLGIQTAGNPDFLHISTDSFKIEDARNLKSYEGEKSFSGGKKIFIISANSILLEAQNTLLKMFEEPIENTHFFLIIPYNNILLKTLVSRFYIIPPRRCLGGELEVAEKFITLPLQKRFDFIKELISEIDEKEEEGNEIVAPDSVRSRALKFLNAVETVLHKKLKNSAVLTLPGIPGGTYTAQNFLVSCFEQIFKAREFLRQPGSSTKSLLESVALVVPSFSK